jgi:hypothetical protein
VIRTRISVPSQVLISPGCERNPGALGAMLDAGEGLLKGYAGSHILLAHMQDITRKAKIQFGYSSTIA